MGDEVVRLSVIGQIIRRRWRPLAALAMVGAILGFGLSLLFSPGYQAASKVLLQGPRDESEVLTEAQIAMSLAVIDKAAADLGWGRTGSQLQSSITATPLDGNVIEIAGVADSEDRARQLTDRVTQEYVAFSTQITTDTTRAAEAAAKQRRAALQQQVDDLTKQISDLQGSPALGSTAADGAQARSQLDQLRSAQISANAELGDVDRQAAQSEPTIASDGLISILEQAVDRGAAAPTLGEFIAGSALVAVLLGVFALVTAARMDGRLRAAEQIEAALGAPVLAGVAVLVGDAESATGAPAQARTATRRNWLRDLLRDDAQWDVYSAQAPADCPGQDIRYRRLLTRLGGSRNEFLWLLVLVPEDDALARRAVAQLVAAAAAGRGPVCVVTDSAEIADLTRSAAGAATQHGLPVSVTSSSDAQPSAARTMFRVGDVAAERPAVPDCGPVSGTLVVLTAGSRTAWELVGVARACADAGHPVVGALVVSPSRVARYSRKKQAPPENQVAHANGSMAGSS